jgi:hypothetical protein
MLKTYPKRWLELCGSSALLTTKVTRSTRTTTVPIPVAKPRPVLKAWWPPTNITSKTKGKLSHLISKKEGNRIISVSANNTKLIILKMLSFNVP